MKKMVAFLVILANFFLTSTSFANEILGYSVTPTQVRFYTLILGLIGFSLGLVAVAYFSFWVLDLWKKKAEVQKLGVHKEKGFAGGLAVAAQSAK
jgi:hypothetical protein